MTNKMEILEQIDRKINQEFGNANVEMPLFISILPLINKVLLLSSTFKKSNSDLENKEKLEELLHFCVGEKTEDFIEKNLQCIKDIHSVLEEIF